MKAAHQLEIFDKIYQEQPLLATGDLMGVPAVSAVKATTFPVPPAQAQPGDREDKNHLAFPPPWNKGQNQREKHGCIAKSFLKEYSNEATPWGKLYKEMSGCRNLGNYFGYQGTQRGPKWNHGSAVLCPVNTEKAFLPQRAYVFWALQKQDAGDPGISGRVAGW